MTSLPPPHSLSGLTLADAVARLRAGSTTAVDLTRAVLERATQTEALHHTYVHLDPAQALAHAAEADRRRAAGQSRSPIDGIPIGLKDLFLTSGLPTGLQVAARHGDDTRMLRIAARVERALADARRSPA